MAVKVFPRFNIFVYIYLLVHTECYVNVNGADYKGRVSETSLTTVLPCKNWLSLGPVDGLDDPLIGNHQFCRNPGGLEDSPYCYFEDNNWDYCTIPTEAQTTCHNGNIT